MSLVKALVEFFRIPHCDHEVQRLKSRLNTSNWIEDQSEKREYCRYCTQCEKELGDWF
jgi:hypothetical protein